MAIAERAAGAWADAAATPQTVTIPAATVATDLMILVCAGKPYTMSPTVSDWTKLGEYANGTTANGNGVGSVRVAVFYKEHSGTESNPSLVWGATPSGGGAVIVSLQKGAGETWELGNLNGATMAAATALSGAHVIPTSMPAVLDGDWIFGVIGVQDDTATMTRATTAITGGGAALIWNGNWVEYPATHFSTVTGNDAAADLGYRKVTTGSSSGTITQTATQAAADAAASVLFCVRVTSGGGGGGGNSSFPYIGGGYYGG